MLNFPERRSEPPEAEPEIKYCPVCGEPIDWDSLPLYHSGDPHYVQRSDITGCAKCTHTINDLFEAIEILED